MFRQLIRVARSSLRAARPAILAGRTAPDGDAGVHREQPGFEVFLTPDALAINEARLSHLASLGLELRGKRVLEVGGGIGLHTCFFESLGCDVLFTDAREENVSEALRRYPGRQAAVVDLEAGTDLAHLGEFDVVYCYGTLYHLGRPAEALRSLAGVCRGMILLETCVTPGEGEEENFEPEWAANPNQAVSGSGCRPTRSWVMRQLRESFGYAYTTTTQPDFPDFETNWSSPGPRKVYRAVFVGSRHPLNSPSLADRLPDETPTRTRGTDGPTLDLRAAAGTGDPEPLLPTPATLSQSGRVTVRVSTGPSHPRGWDRRHVMEHMRENGLVLVSERAAPAGEHEDLVFVRPG